MTQDNAQAKGSRRKFVGTVAGLSAGLAATAAGWLSTLQSESSLTTKVRSLESGLDQTRKELDQKLTDYNKLQAEAGSVKKELDAVKEGWIAYGSGSNLKYMPDPSTKRPTVPLEEIWGFDTNFAFCRVDNNPKAFLMPTFSLGEVVVDANSFFMLMATKSIHALNISELSGGGARITFTGTLDCFTEGGSAGVRFGHRSVAEPAEFEIVAMWEMGKDSFAFTGIFTKDTAPLNHSIFGPKFTFTGEIKTGAVTIKRVKDLKLVQKS